MQTKARPKKTAFSSCLRCKIAIDAPDSEGNPPNYCSRCGYPLQPLDEPKKEHRLPPIEKTLSLHVGDAAPPDHVLFEVDRYKVIKRISQGGMGEVLLVYDPACGRQIALKRIRNDVIYHPRIVHRFLREAKISSQLAHPTIMPIYSIHWSDKSSFYTMPYVDGQTLKQILSKTLHEQRQGKELDPLGGSIPSLIHVFLSVCQAVGYAHSRGIIHRDLKPGNVMIGKFGEVLIFDWGLAGMIGDRQDLIEEELEAEEDREEDPNLTQCNKVMGTANYLSPEVLMRQPASIQSDIYALGVMLYEILTLYSPWERGKLRPYLQKIEEGKRDPYTSLLIDPEKKAPYRDVPNVLSEIVLRCLKPDPKDRYQTIDELIEGLSRYTEGLSEWIPGANLNINRKEDWEFQENILISEGSAITRGTESSDWVHLMLSKLSFYGNTRLEAEICVESDGQGIGFILNAPEKADRTHLSDGMCFWIGSDIAPFSKVYRSGVEVMSHPEIYLKKETWHSVRLEKIDATIRLYIDDRLQFSYMTHRPLSGTHVGVISRDGNFSMKDINVFVASPNVNVNCLAVPDAFFEKKDLETALAEYRRIGTCFPGRAEGREATFRAGVTLMEKARSSSSPEDKEALFDEALDEFGKLRDTAGAPLELLGKALVYKASREFDEELKCYELAKRRYPGHPLMPVVDDHMIHRMHEASRHNRVVAYQFIYAASRYLNYSTLPDSAKKVYERLKKAWEPLPFLTDSFQEHPFRTPITLAFWLARPYAILEMIEELSKKKKLCEDTIVNGFFALLHLGARTSISKHIDFAIAKREAADAPFLKKPLELIRTALKVYGDPVDAVGLEIIDRSEDLTDPTTYRLLLFLLDHAIRTHQFEAIYLISQALQGADLPFHVALQVNAYRISSYLATQNLEHAAELIHLYPVDLLSKESCILHPLYGVWLAVSEGDEIARIHFNSVIDAGFPRSPSLLSHFIKSDLGLEGKWMDRAFLWERRQLYRQLSIYHAARGESQQSKQFHLLEQGQYVDV